MSDLAQDESSGSSMPLYGASFGEAYLRFWKRGYRADAGRGPTDGRASRSEFWWVALAHAIGILIFAGAGALKPSAFTGVVAIIFIVYGLAAFIPQIALCVRRLHDANLPGAMFLLGLIPCVGGIVSLVLYTRPSDPAGAQYD